MANINKHLLEALIHMAKAAEWEIAFPGDGEDDEPISWIMVGDDLDDVVAAIVESELYEEIQHYTTKEDEEDEDVLSFLEETSEEEEDNDDEE